MSKRRSLSHDSFLPEPSPLMSPKAFDLVQRRISVVAERRPSFFAEDDSEGQKSFAEILLLNDQISNQQSSLEVSYGRERLSTEFQSLVSNLVQAFSRKADLQTSLIDCKSDQLVRAKKYAEGCEQKITALREKVAKLEASVEELQKVVKEQETKAVASAAIVDMMQLKYETLKGEYFQNLLCTFGRKYAVRGSESGSVKQLKETFDEFLSERSKQHHSAINTLRPEGGHPSSNTETQILQQPVGKVALVFADVCGLEKEEIPIQAALEMCSKIMRKSLRQNYGYEAKSEGEAMMAAFGSVVHALNWCISVQRELLLAEWPATVVALPCASKLIDEATGQIIFNGIRVRMGVHIGNPVCEVNLRTKRMDYSGPVVNLAARIWGKAQGGQILVSSDVLHAVEPIISSIGEGVEWKSMGSRNFKGIAHSVEIFQLSPLSLRARLFEPLVDDSEFDPVEKFFVEPEPLKMNSGFVQSALRRIERKHVLENIRQYASTTYESLLELRTAFEGFTAEVQELVSKCQEDCAGQLNTAGRALQDVFQLYIAARGETRQILNRRSSGSGVDGPSNAIPTRASLLPVELTKLDWFAPCLKQASAIRRMSLSPAPSATNLIMSPSAVSVDMAKETTESKVGSGNNTPVGEHLPPISRDVISPMKLRGSVSSGPSSSNAMPTSSKTLAIPVCSISLTPTTSQPNPPPFLRPPNGFVRKASDSLASGVHHSSEMRSRSDSSAASSSRLAPLKGQLSHNKKPL